MPQPRPPQTNPSTLGRRQVLKAFGLVGATAVAGPGVLAACSSGTAGDAGGGATSGGGQVTGEMDFWWFNQDKADELAGTSPDNHRQDLYGSIENGDFPSWTMKVQLMPEADAENYRFNPFDLTKVWSQQDYPLIEVGKLTLNRNPRNFTVYGRVAAAQDAAVGNYTDTVVATVNF